MFLLVPAHPGSPGQRAIKRLFLCCCYTVLEACMGLEETAAHGAHMVVLEDVFLPVASLDPLEGAGLCMYSGLWSSLAAILCAVHCVG